MGKRAPIKATYSGTFGTIECTIIRWYRGDPVPVLPKEMSFDNETTLISVQHPVPFLVVTGFFDASTNTVYVVDAADSVEFYEYVYQQTKTLYGYNAQFDVRTSSPGDKGRIYDMLSEKRVLDAGINLKLHWFATRGDVRYDCLNLGNAADKILKMHLDKGKDEGLEADRMTFHVGQEPTDSQLVYLGGDVVSTWYLAKEYPLYPTLAEQGQADYMLNQISLNGIPYDKDVWNYYKERCTDEMLKFREQLKAYGFPVKEEKETPVVVQLNNLLQGVADKLGVPFTEFSDDALSKGTLRALFVEVSDVVTKDLDNDPFATGVSDSTKVSVFLNAIEKVERSSKGSLKKAQKQAWQDFCMRTELLPFDTSGKKNPIRRMLLEYLKSILVDNRNAYEAERHLKEFGDEHAEWLDEVPKVGATKFLQDYLNAMLASHKDLVLEKTKSGLSWKFGKKDTWRLQDCGIKDTMLEAYANFKHMEKYLSTYLNDEFMGWRDGKIHPRFNLLVRSGRTSSGGSGKAIDELTMEELKIPGPNA